MPDPGARYAAGHAHALRVMADAPTDAIRAQLRALWATFAWPGSTWALHGRALEYQFGLLDGMADILRRRLVLGLMELPQ